MDYEAEKYYLGVVDVVEVLTERENPTTVWRVLKHRLTEEGNQTVTNCNRLNEGSETIMNCDRLKLKAADGKYRLIDVVDIEGMFNVFRLAKL